MGKKMKLEPIHANNFYHDGRGPTLQNVIWGCNGIILRGFEFYLPDALHTEEYIICKTAIITKLCFTTKFMMLSVKIL
jgi:hypothetical protein